MQLRSLHSAEPIQRCDCRSRLRLVLLLLPPLLLAILETLHPQPEPTVQAMLDVATWFAVFHAIQLVLIGLVALSVLLLADTLGMANTWAIRLGLGMFLVFFSAYDTLAGIGTGLAMRSARELSATQQEGVLAVVQDWPGLGTTLRPQHPRNTRLGDRRRSTGDHRLPPTHPTWRLDRPGTGCGLPDGRTPVPGRNPRLRILLRRRLPPGMELPPATLVATNRTAVDPCGQFSTAPRSVDRRYEKRCSASSHHQEDDRRNDDKAESGRQHVESSRLAGLDRPAPAVAVHAKMHLGDDGTRLGGSATSATT